ncbi:MAG: metal-dependent hydrolase [Halothece sp. Uz-M2-17]|nr:metal-dependent hydrolase [Halothece sp. Uz-M2-17]
MPSPLAHSISGYVICRVWKTKNHLRSSPLRMNYWLVYAVFISNAPDIDFIIQLFLDEKIHRGFTHSITATLIVSLFAGLVGVIFWKSRWKVLLLLTFIIYSFHLILDALTAGGAGMQLLWPLSEDYYRFPFSLFPPVHHSRGLFDWSHLIFLIYESVYSLLLLWGLKRWQFSQKQVQKNIIK